MDSSRAFTEIADDRLLQVYVDCLALPRPWSDSTRVAVEEIRRELKRRGLL